jgi:hypothetical protein
MKHSTATRSLGLRLAMASLLMSTALGCSAGVASRDARLPASYTAGSDRAADLCAGLPKPEQERPSFLREDAIEAVRPLTSEGASRSAAEELRGAEIVLRPHPSFTKHWVTRVLRCHLADPVGLAMREQFDDPLVVGRPSSVSLEEAGERVVLRIAGRDGADGEEIFRRAAQLQHREVPEDLPSD